VLLKNKMASKKKDLWNPVIIITSPGLRSSLTFVLNKKAQTREKTYELMMRILSKGNPTMAFHVRRTKK